MSSLCAGPPHRSVRRAVHSCHLLPHHTSRGLDFGTPPPSHKTPLLDTHTPHTPHTLSTPSPPLPSHIKPLLDILTHSHTLSWPLAHKHTPSPQSFTALSTGLFCALSSSHPLSPSSGRGDGMCYFRRSFAHSFPFCPPPPNDAALG